MKKYNLLFLLLVTLAGCQKSIKIDHNPKEPITVYSHGYMCNKWVANIFHASPDQPNKVCPNAFIIGPMVSFNYSDYLNPLATHLGQDGDIERLHDACKKYKKVMLVGVSRGASTIINYLAIYQPTNIISVVIESPFDHFDNVAEHVIATRKFYKFIFKNRDKENLKKSIRRILFKNYDMDGVQPIYAASHIPKTIPILVISTEKDRLIPSWSTKNVYNALRESDHNHSYLLACEHGSHGRIAWGKDGQTMRNVIHAFYRQYNIPHHEPWADMGHKYFMQCYDNLYVTVAC